MLKKIQQNNAYYNVILRHNYKSWLLDAITVYIYIYIYPIGQIFEYIIFRIHKNMLSNNKYTDCCDEKKYYKMNVIHIYIQHMLSLALP